MDVSKEFELAFMRIRSLLEGCSPEEAKGKKIVTDVLSAKWNDTKVQFQLQVVFDKKDFLKSDEVALVEKEK